MFTMSSESLLGLRPGIDDDDDDDDDDDLHAFWSRHCYPLVPKTRCHALHDHLQVQLLCEHAGVLQVFPSSHGRAHALLV